MDRFKSKRILLPEQVLSSSRRIRKQKTEVIVWLSCVSWINKRLLSNGSKMMETMSTVTRLKASVQFY